MIKKIGGFLAAVAPVCAFAAPLDVSSATGAMTSVSDTVPVVGAAFLAVLGLMAAWKLARGLF